jgi:trans-2,3-dihydro-3-hydroxyanthranilate isomerase
MSQQHEFQTWDVFTQRRFAGNPLAVLARADGIDPAMMAQIAREFNLSETVFIQSPQAPEAIASLRIFTPAMELPFAGHPTIGASLVLAQRLAPAIAAGGFWIETKAGLVRASVDATGDGLPVATIVAPQIPKSFEIVDAALLAGAIGLGPTDVMTGAFAPAIWSAGTPFTFIAVRDRQALSAARVTSAQWDLAFARNDTHKVFIFTLEDWQTGRQIHARMFAPTLGVPEDPATGSATAALAGLLHQAQSLVDGEHAWTIHQGEDMGRPSVIGLAATISATRLAQVRLSGSAVQVSEGRYLALS